MLFPLTIWCKNANFFSGCSDLEAQPVYFNLFTVFLKDIRLKPVTHCYLCKCHFVVMTSALLIQMFETRKFRLNHC